MAEGGDVENIVPAAAVQTPPPHILPPPPLSLSGDISDNWKTWKTMWQNYEIVIFSDRYPREYQVALFLNALGIEANKVYNTFEFGEGEIRNVETIITKFDTFVIGETNETYERYILNCRVQKDDESFDSYLTEIRNLSKTCNFCDCMRDSLLRDRIVTGIRDTSLKKRLLNEIPLTLAKCIAICKSTEATSMRMKNMGQAEEVNKVSHHKSVKPKQQTYKRSERVQSSNEKKCKFCGRFHVMIRDKCPAWGQKCSKCHGRNHFAKMCNHSGRTKVNQIHESDVSDSDSEYVDDALYIGSVSVECYSLESRNSSEIYAEMKISGKPVTFQIDSGAGVNILTKKYLPDSVKLSPTNKLLKMWNGNMERPEGVARLVVKNPCNGKKFSIEFVVVDDTKGHNFVPLIGSKASQEMNLLTVNADNFIRVNSASDSVNAVSSDDDVKKLVKEFDDLFVDDIGKLPGKVNLKVDATVQPVVNNQNRVPISQRDILKKELDRLVEKGVIIPVDEPTDWVSNLVMTTKRSGEVRICLDPKALNSALKREHFQMPTIDDVLPDLSKARVFSTCDLAAGFWHCELDSESSKLCTFGTPFGRYRWCRLPFGLNVSSEIFQKRLLQALEGLPGVKCIVDDIMIYGQGETKAEADADHVRNLRKLFLRCREQGIKLKREKLKLCRKEVSFLGHVITDQGHKADPGKVKAILDMPPPLDVEGVQRFAGFVNYLAKYLPSLSDKMVPIRELTHVDVDWNWSERQIRAFQDIKDTVANAPILAYYDSTKPLTLQTDASSTGLGAVIMQEGKPLAFASRTLTPAETRYAQIEKEMLSVVYGLEKFHTYTFGRPVTVENDHKPLETITAKPLHSAPKRLQSMIMRTQKYDATIQYRKGKEVVLADTLSRASVNNETLTPCEEEFCHVNMTKFLPITDHRLEQIRKATDDDETMQRLKTVIQNGWPDDKSTLPSDLTPYFHYRDELSIQSGLIFRGERVVVPHSQRSEIKTKLHSSHIGIEGCLRRARECLYWPNMSADIKEYISTCDTCSKFQPDQQPEPLIPHDVPDRPWQKIGTDLFTIHGKDYLVTVDYFSNFWELDYLPDTTSITVIRKLKANFSRYGIPDTVISDNGPQFISGEFHRFVKQYEFDHLTSSPYNSRANGKAESAVKTAKSLLRKAKDTNSDPYIAILDYRNTPTQGLSSSPVQRLMNRRTKTLLPTHSSLLKSKVPSGDVKSKLKEKQVKQKTYFDRKSKPLGILEEGDSVRMKPFSIHQKEWRKGKVVRRLDERSYEVETSNGTCRRNRVHLRKTTDRCEHPNVNSEPICVDKYPSNGNHGDRSDRKSVQSKPTTPYKAKSPAKQNMDTNILDKHVSPKSPTPVTDMHTRSGRSVRKPKHLNDFVLDK